MAEIPKIATEKAPKAIGPYSQAVTANGFLYTSGQIPLDPETGSVAGTDIETQTRRVMENLAAVLEEAGIGFENVVKTTCFLKDLSDFAAFNAVYAEYFVSLPARSCVEVSALPKGVLVEVELIAQL
ncbi:MAG: RidA family protein [Planctomycetaceae bacterium]|nr:RidA family protein [Planctomycetaceae bacterium]